MEEIADQQIGDGVAQIGVVANEVAEAEPVVVLAHEPAHPVDALIEPVAPRAKLRGDGVALRQSLVNRVGGQFARSQREQHAGGIQRIEEAERVADQHPAVAGALTRAVRIVPRAK